MLSRTGDNRVKRFLPAFGFMAALCAVLLLTATFFPGVAEAATRERIRYYVPDHAGSPMRVVTPEGFVTAKYRYAPLGEQLSDKAASGSRAKLAFVGGVQEKSDLVYLKHRYYNPVVGRFYQPDPVGFLSAGGGQINRYVYGRNDTYTYSDADGRLAVQSQMPCSDECTALDNSRHYSASVDPEVAAQQNIAGQMVMLRDYMNYRLSFELLDAGIAASYQAAIQGLSRLISTRPSSSVGVWTVANTAGTRGYRYVTEAEVQAIKGTGMLRGGRPGETFFTKDVYKSGAHAQDRLSLPNAPTHRVEFEITNNPAMIRNGTKVGPVGLHSGRGAEFMTVDPVRVNLINVQPLR